MKLKQRQGFKRKEFELKDNMLYVKTKSINETKEWTVKVETIGTTKYYQKRSKLIEYLVAGFLILFAISISVASILDKEHFVGVGPILFSLTLFGGLAALIITSPRKKELTILGGSTEVTFFPDSPSKEEVEAFIEVLMENSKKILLEKYGKIDIDLPEETQMNNLNWLKNQEILSEEEYERLKLEYKTKKLVT